MKIAATILVAFGVLVVAHATDAEAQQRPSATDVDATLESWRSAKPDLLRDPSNSELLRAVRVRAQFHGDQRARVMLLNAGDPEALLRIKEQLLREDQPFDRAHAAQTLGLCSEPRLILGLIDYVNRDEAVESRRLSAGEEVMRIKPLSVIASEAIREIIVNAESFNEATRTWARRLSSGSTRADERAKIRAAIRSWWEQNQALLRAARYSEVQPPRGR